MSLTKDTVPVDVDAVLFWVVWDAQKAALEVEDYRAAICWAAQSALRDTPALRAGASVIIPRELEDAMSRQAQAERERQARVTRSVGESEKQIASSFAEAAQSYLSNPTVLHLATTCTLYPAKSHPLPPRSPAGAGTQRALGQVGGRHLERLPQ